MLWSKLNQNDKAGWSISPRVQSSHSIDDEYFNGIKSFAVFELKL